MKISPGTVIATEEKRGIKAGEIVAVSTPAAMEKREIERREQALQQEFKKMLDTSLNPTKSDWERISATKTLQKVQNGEYVASEKIESAANTIEAQSEGWAALKNPTPLQKAGKDIADVLNKIADERNAANLANQKKTQQLKNELDKAKSKYEETKKVFKNAEMGIYPFEDERNIVEKVLDRIGGIDYLFEAKENMKTAKTEYQNKKKEYETSLSEYTQNKIISEHGVTADEYINQLKALKKNAKDKIEQKKYDNEIKQLRTDLYGESSVWSYIKNAVKEGYYSANKGVNATTDMTLGNLAKMLGFENNIFSAMNKDAEILYQNASAETLKSAKALGHDSNFAGQAVSTATAMLPDMAITTALFLIPGGQGVAVERVLGSEAISKVNATILTFLKNDIAKTAKNPVFYTSFIRELGTNYEENKSAGASEAEATLAALLSSTINARIELGGIQEFPEELVKIKGKGKAIKDLVFSLFGEGFEENEQRFVSGTVNKVVFDKDKKPFSITDENAIVNPKAMAEEFILSIASSALIGGGQLTFNKILTAASDAEYKTIGKGIEKIYNIQDIIDYCKSSKNDDIRNIARQVNAKNITEADAGRLYQQVIREVRENIDDVYSEADFDAIVKEYYSDSMPETIKEITSTVFANKLSELNIDPEENDTYKSFVYEKPTDNLQSSAKGENNIDTVGGTPSVADGATFPEGEGNGQSRTPVPTNDENVGSGKRIFQSRERHRVAKAEQDAVLKVCKALGVKAQFEHITRETMEKITGEKYDGELPDGYFDKDTGIIHLGFAGVNPIKFVFKHELTHFGEGTAAYDRFISAVRKSKAFKNWLKQCTGLKKGDLKTLEDAYKERISKNYSKDTNLEAEMFSDFVGKVLFNEDGSSLESLLSDLEVKDRNAIIQYLRDFFNYLKKKFAGQKDILFEISHLEDSFNRMLSEAVQTQTQKNTAENSGGVKFSFGVTQAEIDRYVDSAYVKENTEDYKKYAEVSERLIAEVSEEIDIIGYSHALRDNDIRHIKNSHGEGTNEKYPVTSEDIKQIPYIVENYDKVFVLKRDNGKVGIIYIKVNQDGLVYYLEQVTTKYGNEPLLVNKQMIKTGIEDIPNLKGLNEAIKQKQSETEFLADLKKVHEVYAQSVYQSHSNNSIPEKKSTVNNNSTQGTSKNSKNIQFSFAKADDMSLVTQAEQMENELKEKNKSEEEIRAEVWAKTGLIRDTGGIWVYEIDDKKFKFHPDGNALRNHSLELEEFLRLAKLKRKTPEKRQRFLELYEQFGHPMFRKGKLKDFITHDKLFEKYPRLADANFSIKLMSNGKYGSYDPKTDTITLNSQLIKDASDLKGMDRKLQEMVNEIEIENTLIHEIQHALQYYDGRENGSTVDFWNMRLLRGERLPINPETGKEYTSEEAYEYTKGEYEAREASKRSFYTEDDRKAEVPDLGWGKTISAKENATASNIKFSIPSDTDYMSAVESGDTDTAQRMVDEAAKANGYTERLYHQTGADFTEFNTDNQRVGKYDWELPTGTFLKPTDNDIGLKGKKQMELYAKIEKPLTFENRQSAQRFWNDNVPSYKEAVKEIRGIDAEYRSKTDNAMADVRSYLKEWKRDHPDTDSREIYNDTEYQRLNDIEDGIVDEWEEKSNEASLKAKKLIDGFMQGSGFDGIVVTKDAGAQGRSTKSYIVFDSSQLKDASPVTYDDDGNIIALSKRFDKTKRDIRFSIPGKSVDSPQKNIASRRNSVYNEFGSIAMQWANSAAVEQGEIKRLFNGRSRKWCLAIADENSDGGYRILSIGNYEEVKEIERIYEGTNNSLHRDTEKFESTKRRSGGYSLFNEDRRNVDGSIQHTKERQLQSDTKRSNDNLLSGDRRESITNEADSKESAFSMPNEMNVLLDRYESGEITRDEYQAQLDDFWDKTLAEMEDRETAQRIEAARYTNQLEKKIRRKNEQLRIRRSEVVREETERRQERADKQKNIEFIRREIKRLDKKLRSNTEKQHILEEMKEVTAYFVKIFADNDTSPFDKKDIRDIRTLYSDLIGDYNVVTGEGELKTDAFDFNVLADLRILENRLHGKTLRELDLWETMVIRNIVENFVHVINWENKMFLAGREFETDQIGNDALREVKSNKAKRENGLIRGIDSLKYSNMTPIYFFNRLGNTFKKLFNDILDGQGKCVRNWENAKTYITQLKKKHHYSEWENKTFKFTTENDVEVELTVEQAMLLYATAKREYGNKYQRAEHLFKGGVVIEPNAKTLRDIAQKFKDSDKKGRAKLYDAFTDEVNARAVRMLPQDVGKVADWLTKEQKDYADGLVEYLSNDMAALGNEISTKLFGIRKFNENYYIPYNSAQNYLYSQPGVTSETRLKHQSFTKETVVKANNPLMLTDFSTVCADHINRMCMYNALTIPLENLNKIFNYKTFGTENQNAEDMKAEIERVYGKGAVTYIKQFLNDVNGNLQVSAEDKFLNRWMSKFKKGAVFASASVVVQQPSAIMRAMAYIKPKYFAKTTLKLNERDYQQACKYAPVAVLKEIGRFDTGVGMVTTKWLLQETPKELKNKAKAFVDLKDSAYRDDKLSWFAAKADEITWAHIWAAVKAEIADTTNLEKGSEEFLEACGKRFTEVINYTQVYDSTISRSQIMRNKNSGVQMLTAFMSEPTVSLNLLMNAVHEAKNGTKDGKKYAAGAVGAFVGNVVLNALLKSLVTAGRDDDEEKTYGEKYLESFLDETANSINPLTMIPFVKDIVSIFQGYTVERADMNLFSDLAEAFGYLDSTTKTPYEKVEKISGALAAFLGLPVKNILRDVRTAYNIANDLFFTDKKDREVNSEVNDHMTELDGNKTFESLTADEQEKLEKDISKKVRTVQTETENQDEFADLYEALRKNRNLYDRKKKEMLEKGYTATEITDGIEIARILYMKSIGIDVHEYLLYKIATNKKHADTDGSGGVTKAEKKAAVDGMDLDSKAKNYFKNKHK